MALLLSFSGLSIAQETPEEDTIEKFYENYNKTLSECDIEGILVILKNNYWQDYSVKTARVEEGQEDIAYQRYAVDKTHKIFMRTDNKQSCALNYDIKSITLNDNHAIVQTHHMDTYFFNHAPDAPRQNFLCNHYVENNNDVLTFVQSACSVY